MQDTVRDTAVERLSKLITYSRDAGGADNNKDAQSHKPAFPFQLSLEAGWFSLVLLTIVVYSTIWSVQAVNWVDHFFFSSRRRHPRLQGDWSSDVCSSD